MEGGGQGRHHGSAGRQAVVWGSGSGPQWALPYSLPPWPLGRCLCSGPTLQGGVLPPVPGRCNFSFLHFGRPRWPLLFPESNSGGPPDLSGPTQILAGWGPRPDAHGGATSASHGSRAGQGSGRVGRPAQSPSKARRWQAAGSRARSGGHWSLGRPGVPGQHFQSRAHGSGSPHPELHLLLACACCSASLP